MRSATILIFCFSTLNLFAQKENKPNLVEFEGYLLIEDSIPVENAFLINYRTMKIVATDSTGYFKTYAAAGDSLMINHLSLDPKVIHVPAIPPQKQKIRVEYRTYMIQPVVSNFYRYQMNNFEKNMKKMYAELSALGYHPNRSKSVRLNPYNPDETDPGLTISLSDLFGLFKKRK